ncbi:DUF7312 domain-containing protein [Natrarchaeobius chitinivorans]|uniref:DUF7312 domain-containing protein n=1 Tax=Natrarchaeobius chitinivorans TaxID=1679083 RepID=A0A3N6M322_NATCH|nr:hypothetical protein [Natrarchaeobius chitinivorans]RQG97858.1 hypothetical protein EA473_01250 [Natrarchaeobius chitinivorans]
MADDASGTDDDAGTREPVRSPDVSSDETGTDPRSERDSIGLGAGSTDGAGEADADRERIPIDLSGDRYPDPDESDDDADDDRYVPEPSSTPIETGDPSLENALFVVLGAVAMILVIVRVISLPF